MRRFSKIAAFFLCSFLTFSTSYAAQSGIANATPAAPVFHANTTTLPDDAWRFTVAPYLWALNMNGTVHIKTAHAHVNQTFNDILNEMNWAGMLWVEANKDKFGVFGNALYASLSQSASAGLFSAHVNNNFGLYSAGVSYEIYKKCFCQETCESDLIIEPYLGFRHTVSNIQLTLNTPLGNVRKSKNEAWTDPIVGARFRIDMTKAWTVTLAGDVGGTNTNNHYSYNVLGLLGYKPQTIMKYTTWYLGYRLLDQHYVTGVTSNYYNWNMKLFGPIASVAFNF